MADSTIQNLSTLTENIKAEDVFPMSHHETDEATDYITYKVTMTSLANAVKSKTFDAVAQQISADLDLKNLAWKDKVSDAEIASSKLNFRTSVTGYPTKTLALSTYTDLSLGNLAGKNLPELGLRALAFKNKIGLGEEDNLSGLLPLNKINYSFGDLKGKNEADLDLKTLAHRDRVNLDAHNEDGGVYGYLDFSHIKNFTPYDLPTAAADKKGGIKIGYEETAGQKKYAVQLDSNNKAFVQVPWANTDTLSTYSFTGGTNGFTVTSNAGTVQTVKVTPSIADNLTGVGVRTDRNLAVFTGSTTLSAGIQLGNDTGKWLRNDGKFEPIPKATQAADGVMTKEDKKKLDDLVIKDQTVTPTTYSFTDGTNGFTVKTNKGTEQTVKVTPSIPENITGVGTRSNRNIAVFTGSTTLSAGIQLGSDINKWLRNDGTFQQLPKATQSVDGVMSKEDKKKLDELVYKDEHNTSYVLPTASATEKGGILTNYAENENGKNYKVRVDDSGNGYVNVNWQNDNTTYTAGTGLKLTGTKFEIDTSLFPPGPAIKYSDSPIIQSSGLVYSGSKSEAVATWTSPGECIVTVACYLRCNVSSCGWPHPRYVRFKTAGGTFKDVLAMSYQRAYSVTFVCKKGDQVQVTGHCSASHGTDYDITGTYLTRT